MCLATFLDRLNEHPKKDVTPTLTPSSGEGRQVSAPGHNTRSPSDTPAGMTATPTNTGEMPDLGTATKYMLHEHITSHQAQCRKHMVWGTEALTRAMGDSHFQAKIIISRHNYWQDTIMKCSACAGYPAGHCIAFWGRGRGGPGRREGASDNLTSDSK